MDWSISIHGIGARHLVQYEGLTAVTALQDGGQHITDAWLEQARHVLDLKLAVEDPGQPPVAWALTINGTGDEKSAEANAKELLAKLQRYHVITADAFATATVNRKIGTG